MDEINTEIIITGMRKFGLSQDEIKQQLDNLTQLGLTEKINDNYKLTESGIKYVKDVILKRKNYE